MVGVTGLAVAPAQLRLLPTGAPGPAVCPHPPILWMECVMVPKTTAPVGIITGFEITIQNAGFPVSSVTFPEFHLPASLL